MTQEEQNAIEAAKAHWGRVWRIRLTFAWESAAYPASLKPHAPTLQRLRNTKGTDWLYKI